jgi:hypothetical protein
MMKNVTTLIATHRKTVVRKATVIGGVILGIGIGLLLNKVDDDDMVIINGEYTEDEDFSFRTRPIEDLTSEELEQADRNIVGE